MFLVGPMVVAGFIFFSQTAAIVRIPLSVLIGGIGLFVALVPVQGRPFDKWIVAFIHAIFAPTQRIWVKERNLPEFLSVVIRPQTQEQKIPEEITERGRERLIAYLRSLPKDNESPLDMREDKAIFQLDLGGDDVGAGSVPPPIIWPSAKNTNSGVSRKVGQPVPREVGPDSIKIETPVAIRAFDEKSKVVVGNRKQLPIVGATEPRIAKHAQPFVIKGLEDRLRRRRMESVPKKSPPLSHLASDTNFSVDNIISLKEPDNKIRLVRGVGQTRVRKLHFAPPENFDLSKLPIRGERRFEISDELARRFNFEDDTPQVVLPNETNSTVGSVQFANKLTEADLSQVLPKAQVRAPEAVGGMVAAVAQGTQKAPKRKDDDQTKFSITDKKQIKSVANNIGAQIIPLTSNPNVLSGMVTDSIGTPLEGAVLVVRDAGGIPIRALKTNKLGQFLSATPLSDGNYTIEIESEKASFVPTSISLKGEILAPLGLQGQVKN